jgi:two-component system, chemotaxis family, response regulator WspR
VILPVTNASDALTVAERICGVIVALGIAHAGAAGGVASVSIGVASIVPPSSGERSMLVEAADAELYTAKRMGRNRTSVRLDAPTPSAPA